MTTVKPTPSHSQQPGPIEPQETFRFPSGDGTGLYAEFFPVSRPRGAALILHGYHEHCGRYREVAHVLNQSGLTAMSFDMRGHGRADGQRGYVDRFEDYLDDLDAALDAMDRRVQASHPDETLPRLLVGHSNGGLVALRALSDPSRRPANIAAAVVSSPFLGLKLKVSRARNLLGQAAARWLPKLSLPNPLAPEMLTSDPAKQAERRVDTLCHDVASARWFKTALEAHEYVAEFASRIDVPTLWLVAEGDRIADPAASRVVSARLRAPSRYEGLDMEHEVFNERDRARVFGLLQAYVDHTLPPLITDS